jgi:hypothetical protein
MPSVDLSDQEWNSVMAIIGEAPWKVAHPLLMRIGQQLQAQKQPAPPPSPLASMFPKPAPGNGADMEADDGQ